MNRKVSAIVLAGGTSERLRAERNKPFIVVGGRTLLAHSIDRLRSSEAVSEVVVVLNAQDRESGGEPLAEQLHGMGVDHIVLGGARRQDSCRAGFEAVDREAEVVLVHDAARPFASPQLIRAVVEEAVEHGAAAPALPASDSVKEGAGGFLVRSIPRSVVYLCQTPQGFRRSLMARMFSEVEGADLDVSDDAEMAEIAGIKVRIVPGERTNIKVTAPDDLLLAELLLRRLAG